jgi:hypothetical protein
LGILPDKSLPGGYAKRMDGLGNVDHGMDIRICFFNSNVSFKIWTLMILVGIVELPNERLYFGRRTYYEEEGFGWIISDTPNPYLGFCVHTGVGTGLRDAIKLFLRDDYAGSFDQRRNELQRQINAFDKIKAKFPDYKPPTTLYEKYNLHP